MITYNGLPLYRVALDKEKDGVLRVSLVDDPAVQSDFEVFRKQQERPAMYSVQNEEKRLVRGVILRADFPIYRRDNDGDPGYYVTFGADVIRQAAEKYLADGRQNAVDTDHDGKEVDDVQMVQLFIKDSAAGIAPEGFDDIADGSLFGEYHVTNDDVWDEIKAGTFKGFSVEIFYTLIPAGDAMHRETFELDEAEVLGTIAEFINSIDNMSKLERIKARLAAILAEPKEPQKFGSVTTDKGVIYWDGDEDLKAGDRVEVEAEDGSRSAAADGDYITEDGKTIVVVDGAVSEIRDPEAEGATTEEEKEKKDEPTAQEQFSAKAAQFAASYGEKMQAIADAVRAALNTDLFYIVDAGDDFAVVSVWENEAESLYQFSVSWNEDGTASVGDKMEVVVAYVPKDGGPEEVEMEKAVNDALAAAEQFKAENETLKARIAELEKTPAGAPAHELFKNDGPDGASVANGFKTGDKGLDRLARKIR